MKGILCEQYESDLHRISHFYYYINSPSSPPAFINRSVTAAVVYIVQWYGNELPDETVVKTIKTRLDDSELSLMLVLLFLTPINLIYADVAANGQHSWHYPLQK